MGVDGARLNRTTRYFVVTSASALVFVQAVPILFDDRHLFTVLAVFGFICPMIFGMAYLLLPSFVGRTLTHQRIPAVHLVLAYTGTAAIVGGQFFSLDDSFLAAGIVLWSLGVGIFLGELLWTAVPAVADQPTLQFSTGSQSLRPSPLAMVMVPVALGYLLFGTVALLGRTNFVPVILPPAYVNILHFYTAGFGALLIFAIGTRLLPGFFHVDLPNRLGGGVLIAGAVGPILLGTYFLQGIWFRVGALLEAIALIGYTLVVVSVYWRSDRSRIGLYGILLGAVAGVSAVVFGLSVEFALGYQGPVTSHVELILNGFFALTIIGYVYQFYPVTTGQFFGASRWTALTSIVAIAIGVFLRLAGNLDISSAIEVGGSILALFGTIVYWYLIGRRTLPS